MTNIANHDRFAVINPHKTPHYLKPFYDLGVAFGPGSPLYLFSAEKGVKKDTAAIPNAKLHARPHTAHQT